MKTVLLLCCMMAPQAFAALDRPSNLNATALSASKVELTWNYDSNSETGFILQFRKSALISPPWDEAAVRMDAVSYTHSGLDAATTYQYRLKAWSMFGSDSTWTPSESATTMPGSLTATASSNPPIRTSRPRTHKIDLSWIGNAGNIRISGYTIYSATNAGFTGANIHFVKRTDPATFSSIGLYAGTTYFFKIKAEGISDSYDSPFTPVVSARIASAAPIAPNGLTASAMSSSSVELSWTDNSLDEEGFELQRATDNGFTKNVARIGGIGSGSDYTNTGLSSSTTYWYRVRAIKTEQDSAYSSAVSATTSPSIASVAPRDLTATTVASSRVDLIWTSNQTSFELTRATDGGFSRNVVTFSGINGSSYVDTGLSPSTLYYYEVRAKTAAATSAASNRASAITRATPVIAEGVAISPRFFGVNAWMPHRVGGAERLYGKLDEKWTAVQGSRVRTVRYGGTAIDEADPQWIEAGPVPSDFCPTDSSRESTMQQYLDMIDDIRVIGAEPIVQVPVLKNVRNAQQAAALVRCINGMHLKGVKYWSIGNEPDNAYGWDTAAYADDIAGYVKSFASAMKAVDPSIRIMAPEIASFNWDILNLLTGGGDPDIDITGQDASGRYYVDVISFHTYPYPENTTNWPTRDEVIASPAAFNTNLQKLKTRVDARNFRRRLNPLTIGVTEANINYENPTTESLDGEGATSFIGGQFSAEMMGIAMQQGVDFYNFWSVIEGNSISNDIGYLGRNGVTVHPSYEHFKMMAEHFRGNALLSNDDIVNVKTFAAKDRDQIVVMIINQDATTSFPYAISFDATPTESTLNVNVPANVAAQYSSTTNLEPQSTLLLVFDSAGTLKKTIEYKR